MPSCFLRPEVCTLGPITWIYVNSFYTIHDILNINKSWAVDGLCRLTKDCRRRTWKTLAYWLWRKLYSLFHALNAPLKSHRTMWTFTSALWLIPGQMGYTWILPRIEPKFLQVSVNNLIIVAGVSFCYVACYNMPCSWFRGPALETSLAWGPSWFHKMFNIILLAAAFLLVSVFKCFYSRL